MITRDQIVQRFLAECKTSQTNQEAVDKVEGWLREVIMNAEHTAPEEIPGIKVEANEAGSAILMLIKCTEAVARRSSSVPPSEAFGQPGIVQGPPPGGA